MTESPIEGEPEKRKTRSFGALLRTFRLRQWVKSGIILAPALFTLKLFSPDVLPKLAAALAGFSLVASALYAFNDYCNRKEDRLHPVKRRRPLASGDLSPRIALPVGALLLIFGLVLLNVAARGAFYLGAAYALLMAAYSLILRRIMILDVLVVSAGFVLRVLVGGAAISEEASHWLILCTFTIALFLSLIKRRQELAALETGGETTRSTLAHYPPLPILDGWIAVASAMTLICYALYTVDPLTVAKHYTHNLIYTLPFVIFGIFRYHRLAVTGRAGEDPSELALKDRGLQAIVALWGAASAGVLWWAKRGM